MSVLAGKNLLVTGGTGSFARAFVRRALDEGAKRVVIYSRDELKQAQVRAEFGNDPALRWFIGDVRSYDRLLQAMNGVEVVIHSAAMKRIEVCEEQPDEAIATNITGTQNVARACIRAGVAKALVLSTDKAPCAHTLYGMTKAVAERSWVQSNVYAAGGPTKLSATRYGNVLGSRGSVLDVWRKQFAANEPLTITSERATRFWMTIGDAVDLVLLALAQMQGGDVFVPKVGSSSVLDLARAVVEIDGTPYTPGHVVTGLRPGERLHETLISEEEGPSTFDYGTHYVIESESPTWSTGSALTRMYARMEHDPNSRPVRCSAAYRSDSNRQCLTVEELQAMIA